METLIAAIQAGMITSALQLAGAQRRGENSDDYGNCPDTGGGAACTKLHAVSIPSGSDFDIGFRCAREL